ncbi:hypothetical protein KR222_010859, partial [Zaprionus bogoriensis]
VIKIVVFTLIWLFFTAFIITQSPEFVVEALVPLKTGQQYYVGIDLEPKDNIMCLTLTGGIDVVSTTFLDQAPENSSRVNIALENYDKSTNTSLWKTKTWTVIIDDSPMKSLTTVKSYFTLEDDIRFVGSKGLTTWGDVNIVFRVSLESNHKSPVAFTLIIDSNPLNVRIGAWLGLLLLIFFYILIIFHVTDRTFAAMLAATAAVGVLCMMDKAPHFNTIISWIDMKTLMLLFGLMVMMSILAETGLFEYLTMVGYRISKGYAWLLLFYLYMLTGILSAFFNNVTIVMLILPITIRLCEVLGLRTQLVLIGVAIFSNIGGTLTSVGSPPNLIIYGNRHVSSRISIGTFTLHMFVGVLLAMIVGFIVFYILIRNRLVEETEQQLKRSIVALQRQQELIKNNPALKKEIGMRLQHMRDRLVQHQANIFTEDGDYKETLLAMKERFKIKNMPLLIKCCIALGVCLILFVCHGANLLPDLNLSWSAILAVLLLFILVDPPHVEKIIENVEWSTLIFLAALFVLMQALVILGLIDWMGDVTIHTVESMGNSNRLAVAILMLLWISAISSAVVNNIPITTMMISVAVRLAYNQRLGLPLGPLLWSLSFGACFGGNGTLIGAVSNVVAAGVAFRHGHDIKFLHFFLIGLPIMIITVIMACLYLLIVHWLLSWH